MTQKRKARSYRIVGLDLLGAKNQKTTLAVLEYYPKEQKIFLVDVHSGIGPESGQIPQSGDEAVLKAIADCGDPVSVVGVSVPLTLPPCISCNKSCASKCNASSVKWMRETIKKAAKRFPEYPVGEFPQIKEFTPYTQRPFELWARYHLLPELDSKLHFEIDETLGGNRAPLAARMHYLKRYLRPYRLVETWPKLSIAILAAHFKIRKQAMAGYRSLDGGAAARAEIIDILSKNCEIFVYERDAKKLAGSLSAFDAFICAYTALLSRTGHCAKPPKNFPVDSGWVEHPIFVASP